MPLSPTMRRDVISAYGASFARIASWVVVSAIVYRKLGASAFALLTLVRSTVGLLAYSAWGLGPAMISRLASASAAPVIVTAVDEEAPTPILSYASRGNVTPNKVYSSAMWMVALIALGATFLAGFYSVAFNRIHNAPTGYSNSYFLFFFVFTMCLGVIARVTGEVSGAVLQTNNRIAL